MLGTAIDMYTCSSFCLKGNNQIVLCKNLDWDFDYGMIVLNKRGLFKKAFNIENDNPVEWVSRYGSITFNHIGKEFPLGGMNEAGLAIEEMNYYSTRYPAPDNRPVLNELQWIQYQLDNFSTVKEVINSDSSLRIKGNLFKIHYLVCDRNGNTAAIEFLNGKMVCHTGNSLVTPVLTNHRYDESAAELKNYKGFGGNKEIPQEYESLKNFIRASSLINKYSSDKPVADYSFNILSSVSTFDTQWSIVYDVTNSRIYFKTRQCSSIKQIDLNKFDFSCDKKSLCLDVNTKLKDNVSSKFIPFSIKINGQLVDRIYNAYSKSDYLDKEFDKTYFEGIKYYPQNIKCKVE